MATAVRPLNLPNARPIAPAEEAVYDIETEFRADPQRFTATRDTRKTVILAVIGAVVLGAAIAVTSNYSAFYDHFGPKGEGVGSRYSSNAVLRIGTALFPVLLAVIGFFLLGRAYRAIRWHRSATGAVITPLIRRTFLAAPVDLGCLAQNLATGEADSFLPFPESDSKGGALIEIWLCQRDEVAYVLLANRVEQRRVAFLELRADRYELIADLKERGLLNR